MRLNFVKTLLLSLAVSTAVFAPTATAYAAGSPTAETIYATQEFQAVTSTKVSSGYQIESGMVTTSTCSEATAQAKTYDASASPIAAVDLTLYATASDGSKTYVEELPSGQSVTVSIQVTGLSSKANVIAMHKKHDGTWERVTAVNNNGTVDITLTSCSPIVLFSTGEGDAVVAPRTGDNNVYILLLSGILLACASVITVRVAKRH